jgi:hypothetical protein
MPEHRVGYTGRVPATVWATEGDSIMSNLPPGEKRDPPPIDLAEVSRLIAAMQTDLAGVKNGSRSVEALRAEVVALSQSLGARTTPVGPEDLHRVRGLLKDATDEVEVDALKAAAYVTQLGRILGLS